MGKRKHIERIEALFKKSPIVSFSSIERIIKDKKNVKQYTKQFIRNQVLQGKIKPLTKGFYTIHEETSLIVFCFKPSYLGLQDALSIHNLWEQETNPVIITTRKVRQGLRKVFGNNFVLHRISPKYFFGFEYMQNGDFYFPVSDIEKTLIDLVYYRMYINPETLQEFRNRIDKKKLREYLKVYPERLRKRVNGLMKMPQYSGGLK